MNGIDRCVWLSISPGSTKQPAASMTSVPSGVVDVANGGDLLAVD